MALQQTIEINNEVFAQIKFEGLFESDESKRDLFTKKLTSILSQKHSDPIDLGLKSHYRSMGRSIIAFNFIDPQDPRVSETMATIVPVSEHKDKFSDIFIQTVHAGIVQPSTNRDHGASPKNQKPVMS